MDKVTKYIASTARFMCGVSSLFFLISAPVSVSADIYRFVTVDGVESFTDAPLNKDAKVVIKESSKSSSKRKKDKASQKVHNVSLDENH